MSTCCLGVRKCSNRLQTLSPYVLFLLFLFMAAVQSPVLASAFPATSANLASAPAPQAVIIPDGSSVLLADGSNTLSAGDQMVLSGPVSVQSVLPFANTWNDEATHFWLAGLATRPKQTPDAISLEWALNTSGWFASWQLQLHSGVGALQPLQGTVESGDANTAVLNRVGPTPGHTYESLLSYDPTSGVVGIAVTDTTDRKFVYTGTFRLAVKATPLYPVAAIAPQEGLQPEKPLPWFAAFAVDNAYVPVWTNWEVGKEATEADAYAQAYLYECNSRLAMRLAEPVPVSSGAAQNTYLVTLTDSTGNQIYSSQMSIKDQVWEPIPLDRLPLGKVTASLQYVHAGHIWLTEQRELQIGSLQISVDQVALNAKRTTLQGSLLLTSPSDLTGLKLTLKATFLEMVWNQDTRSYQEKPEQEFTVLEVDRFPAPGASAVIPISLPLPTRPGAWKVAFRPETNLPVRAELSGIDQIFATYKPAVTVPGEPYTIAVFPDTQNYTVAWPHILTRQAQWVAENAADQRIGLMLHMGDVTQDNAAPQWVTARQSLGLLDGVIPYALAVGNHDLAPSGGVNSRGNSLISQYFPPAAFPALGGTFAPGRTENTYHLVNLAGTDYLIISMEFGPPDEVLDWANSVADTYPNHKVIVITHTYVSKDGRRGGDCKRYGLAFNKNTTVNDGNDMWNKLISKHGNMFLVLSGHIGTPVIPKHIDTGVNGNKVYEFLMDFQEEQLGGNGWMVLFTVQPDGNIEVRAYSPFLAEWKTGHDAYGNNNHFLIDVQNGRFIDLE